MLLLRLAGTTKNVALIFVYFKYTTFKITNYNAHLPWRVSKTSVILMYDIFTVIIQIVVITELKVIKYKFNKI